MKAQITVVDGGGIIIGAAKGDEVGGVFEDVGNGGGAPCIEGVTVSVDGVADLEPGIELVRKLGPDVSDVNVLPEALIGPGRIRAQQCEVLDEDEVLFLTGWCHHARWVVVIVVVLAAVVVVALGHLHRFTLLEIGHQSMLVKLAGLVWFGLDWLGSENLRCLCRYSHQSEELALSDL